MARLNSGFDALEASSRAEVLNAPLDMNSVADQVELDVFRHAIDDILKGKPQRGKPDERLKKIDKLAGRLTALERLKGAMTLKELETAAESDDQKVQITPREKNALQRALMHNGRFRGRTTPPLSPAHLQTEKYYSYQAQILRDTLATIQAEPAARKIPAMEDLKKKMTIFDDLRENLTPTAVQDAYRQHKITDVEYAFVYNILGELTPDLSKNPQSDQNIDDFFDQFINLPHHELGLSPHISKLLRLPDAHALIIDDRDPALRGRVSRIINARTTLYERMKERKKWIEEFKILGSGNVKKQRDQAEANHTEAVDTLHDELKALAELMLEQEIMNRGPRYMEERSEIAAELTPRVMCFLIEFLADIERDSCARDPIARKAKRRFDSQESNKRLAIAAGVAGVATLGLSFVLPQLFGHERQAWKYALYPLLAGAERGLSEAALSMFRELAVLKQRKLIGRDVAEQQANSDTWYDTRTGRDAILGHMIGRAREGAVDLASRDALSRKIGIGLTTGLAFIHAL